MPLLKRRKLLFAGISFLILGIFFLVTGAPEPPAPVPPGAFAFAALGDAPYYPWEDLQYRRVLRELERNDLRWVLHVGDIFWHPCTDEMYQRSLGWFNGLRHPVIYTPGDNEWMDCWESGSGSYEPQDRLARIRQIFFAHPNRSLGGNPLPLASQGGRPPFPELVENARWTHQGIVFATVHLIGSWNGTGKFTGRTEADDVAARRRTDGAVAWMRETFAQARAAGASAVVLGFHANPKLEGLEDNPYRRVYDPFVLALEEEAERFARPVLVIQGDDHDYIVDRPLVRRTTGRRLENLTRLQVPGSPQVGWVRVLVTPGAASPFAFEPRVVPRWKYW